MASVLKPMCGPPVVSKIRSRSFAYRRGGSSRTDSRKYQASSPDSNDAASPASGSTSGFSPGIARMAGCSPSALYSTMVPERLAPTWKIGRRTKRPDNERASACLICVPREPRRPAADVAPI